MLRFVNHVVNNNFTLENYMGPAYKNGNKFHQTIMNDRDDDDDDDDGDVWCVMFDVDAVAIEDDKCSKLSLSLSLFGFTCFANIINNKSTGNSVCVKIEKKNLINNSDKLVRVKTAEPVDKQLHKELIG